jgi:hypothetical protein
MVQSIKIPFKTIQILANFLRYIAFVKVKATFEVKQDYTNCHDN